ncbi:MAG TPA: Uma2 family endonuclease [Bryobacteraceae bacterium]|nr:Uma2 family endonuclease [Bryobacteraceae bacterium]
MGAAKTLLTAEEFDNYPFEEDKRYELDEGELIETERPAYWHNHVVGTLVGELCLYCRQTRRGEALISENLYALSAKTRRSPDAAVILGDHYQELRNAKVIPIIPDIAVEVLSPSETPRMIHRELKQYFAAGVREVWLIDPDSREVEIWTRATLPDRALTEGETLTSLWLPDFGLALAVLFA